VAGFVAFLLACWLGGVALGVVLFVSDTPAGANGWSVALAVSVAVISVATAPALARWLRPAVTALFVSHWDSAQSVLTDVGQHLGRLDAGTSDPDELIAEIAAQVARRLRLPHVAILDSGVGSDAGPEWDGSPLTEVPLRFAGASVGTLVVAPRAGETGLSVAEIELLRELAVHIGITVHAARASADVQASRAALVTAREEERRRIRRDLHDGLGPTLASLRLHLAALETLVDTDPGRARELVERLRDDVGATSGQIRNLVYGLRPAMLDEFGLVEAIRSQAGDDLRLDIEISGAGLVGRLPAAVEVALYRIACESIANVIRHSGAAHCRVVVTEAHGEIRMEVLDDGRGLPDGVLPGVGLVAMRDRAQELGGQCSVTSRGSGTSVMVSLPLPVGELDRVDGGAR
jgi:two-component system NarL family sensor kinase